MFTLMLLFGLQQGNVTLGGLHCGLHGYCTLTSTLPSGKLFPSTSVCLSCLSVCLFLSLSVSLCFFSHSLCVFLFLPLSPLLSLGLFSFHSVSPSFLDLSLPVISLTLFVYLFALFLPLCLFLSPRSLSLSLTLFMLG